MLGSVWVTMVAVAAVTNAMKPHGGPASMYRSIKSTSRQSGQDLPEAARRLPEYFHTEPFGPHLLPPSNTPGAKRPAGMPEPSAKLVPRRPHEMLWPTFYERILQEASVSDARARSPRVGELVPGDGIPWQRRRIPRALFVWARLYWTIARPRIRDQMPEAYWQTIWDDYDNNVAESIRRAETFGVTRRDKSVNPATLHTDESLAHECILTFWRYYFPRARSEAENRRTGVGSAEHGMAEHERLGARNDRKIEAQHGQVVSGKHDDMGAGPSRFQDASEQFGSRTTAEMPQAGEQWRQLEDFFGSRDPARHDLSEKERHLAKMYQDIAQRKFQNQGLRTFDKSNG